MIEQQLVPIGTEAVVYTHGPFSLTATGVVQTGPAAYEEWERVFQWAQAVEGAAQFWLGDLIEIGQATYGEKYSQALNETAYAEQTLKNLAYVSRSIPPERRRSTDKVPWAMHAEVASLPEAQQTHWLDVCEKDQLTRDQLRKRIKTAQAEEAGQPVEYWLSVRCADQQDQETLADKLRLEGRSVKIR